MTWAMKNCTACLILLSRQSCQRSENRNRQPIPPSTQSSPSQNYQLHVDGLSPGPHPNGLNVSEVFQNPNLLQGSTSEERAYARNSKTISESFHSERQNDLQ